MLIRDYSLHDANTRKRNRKFTMSQSEVMTIQVLLHRGAFKNLKSFYVFYVQKHMQEDFANTVSYNRFVELQRKVSVPLAIFVKMMCLGKWFSKGDNYNYVPFGHFN